MKGKFCAFILRDLACAAKSFHCNAFAFQAAHYPGFFDENGLWYMHATYFELHTAEVHKRMLADAIVHKWFIVNDVVTCRYGLCRLDVIA